LDTAQFETDVTYLKKHFGFITYDRLVQQRSQRKIAPDNVAVLTFDDGFAECFTVVRPILLRHGASCIFFVITDFIDNQAIFRETQASLCIDAIISQPLEAIDIVHKLALDAQWPPLSAETHFRPAGFPLDVAALGCKPDPRLQSLFRWLLTISFADVGLMDRLCEGLGIDVNGYLQTVKPYLSSDQIRQLQSDGFTIGAHSCSHRRLQELSPCEAEREIVESCRIVRDLTGQKSIPFAFPYFGGDLDRTWLAQLRQQHDFIGLFFDTGGLSHDAPFVVQRVFGERINRDGSIDNILRRAWARRTAWHRGN
jgi:peptidoglycan/xylan/chitin deacetylase (PgdA/CDA1 family)